ncbi:MAG TPA: chemotaxis protein CheA [Candidatus Acidoferrum sp.]|nr:chemotaxis protein CheA [Candidatus Acidoferrum sp.]
MSLTPDERSSELRELFFESSAEILQSMNEAGLALEVRPGDLEKLRSVRRAVHTLKGDSAACGFRALSELAHELEDVLTPELATENAGLLPDVVLAAADTFHEMLAAYRSNLQPPDGGALREHIRRLLRQPTAGAKPQAAKQEAKFAWTEYERLLINQALAEGTKVFQVALHLDQDALLPAAAHELVKKALEACGKLLAIHPEAAAPLEPGGLIEAVIASSKGAETIRKRCHVPSVVGKVSVEAVTAKPEAPRDLLEILLESEAAAVAAGVTPARGENASTQADEHGSTTAGSSPVHLNENTLRVDAGRIDTVMNLVGELIIGKSMLQRTIAEFDRQHPRDLLRAKFSDALSFQSRVLGELQKSVMKIRMVPVEQLFRRFPRVVRDVAKLRNKDIALEIAGQNTDLDKGILDSLAEPLAHLVRNAADHGIESQAEREAAGKPARGMIRLNAYHEGDQVVIEISDDGRGLDREKIVRKAIERNIVTPLEASRLNEMEGLQLIFTPGLSTADEITEISGRGVGLDVVKTALEYLKGTVDLRSEPGKGTTFRLMMPLTLASIQALLFRVGERLYAVPLASVVEITRVTEEEIHRVNEREVFQLRDEVLNLVRLAHLDPTGPKQRARRLFVIVIGAGTRKFGLAVDSLMGEEELVIKALEDHLVTSPLVSGASILGDGTVVLILNVPVVLAHLSRIPAVGATA